MPKESIEKKVADIESSLAQLYPNTDELIGQTSFNTALNYTLLAGGKRIRPLFALVFSQICSMKKNVAYNEEDCMPIALALEMVHTYSLIHDDLPSMDNDDLRRGKPTCHKKFDEATAILTGDALLTDAFGVLAKAAFNPEQVVQAISFLSTCAGSKGMVAGQILDMAMEENNIDFNKDIDLKEALTFMNQRKTGDLLLASCCLPPMLYNLDKKFYSECSLFAMHFGLAFQISDDVLDVEGDASLMGKPQGSDIAANKTTWVRLLGIEEAKKEVLKHIEKAQEYIQAWEEFCCDNPMPCTILSSLLQSLNNRVK